MLCLPIAVTCRGWGEWIMVHKLGGALDLGTHKRGLLVQCRRTAWSPGRNGTVVRGVFYSCTPLAEEKPAHFNIDPILVTQVDHSADVVHFHGDVPTHPRHPWQQQRRRHPRSSSSSSSSTAVSVAQLIHRAPWLKIEKERVCQLETLFFKMHPGALTKFWAMTNCAEKGIR